MQYPRLNSGAIRQVALIVFHDFAIYRAKKRVRFIGKTRALHLRHQINTFSASLFTGMRAHGVIAFVTI